MSNPTKGPLRTELKARRLAWLRERGELLSRLPGTSNDVGPNEDLALSDAAVQMRDQGLFGKKTARADLRWSIRLLVEELRGRPINDFKQHGGG